MSQALSAAAAREQDAGAWRRTAPLGLLARMLVNLRRSVLPLIAVAVGGREWGGTAAIVSITLLVLLLNAGGAWIAWRHFRYRIGTDDIRVERGLVSRTTRSVPYERIQDVSIEEAPIPRILGLVEVRFETAGGGKDEVKLAYVTRAEGQALRDTVRAVRATPTSGTGSEAADAGVSRQPEPAEHARTLFMMDLPRLLTFGVFEFSLVIFAVLFGAAQQFEALLPCDIWDIDEWRSRADLPLHLLLGLGIAAQAVAATLGLIVLGFLGLATGLGRTVLRDYGFVLEETERGLRRRRGLLTRTDVVMPVHRVQALTVTTGIVRRRFGPRGGWHGLGLVSLASDAKSASHTVVPFGGMHEIARVASVAGFTLPGPQTEWQQPSGRYRLDQGLLCTLPPAVFAAGLALAGLVVPALGIAVLAMGAALRHLFLWRFERYALDERQIYVRRGWLAPRTDVGSRLKIQSVEIIQGPLGQRRGYADVIFGVAGGTLKIKGAALPAARAVRAAVLESIAAVDFSLLPGQQPLSGEPGGG